MKHILLLLSVFLLHGLSEARLLTWEQAIELTEAHHPELKAAFDQYQSVLFLERTGYSPFLPTINANARGTHSGGETASGTSASTHSYGADLTLSQNLFSSFADYQGLKIRKLNSAQAKLDFDVAKARISQELKQVYADMYLSQQNKKLASSILKRRQENLRSVQLQYENGRENKGSFLLSQANVDQAQLDILKAQNAAEVAMDNFRRFLGIENDEYIELEKNIVKSEEIESAPAFSKLVENHNTVQKVRNEESLARANLRVSQAEFGPSLNFSASTGYSDLEFFPEQNKNWSMGLTLTWQLFEGGRDYATLKSNSSKLSASGYNLRNTMQTLLRDLKRAYYDYAEAFQQEKVDNSLDQAAQMRAEIARNKYKNGLITFEDWDQIENEMIQRQRAMLSSERNRIVQQSLWERAQVIGVIK